MNIFTKIRNSVMEFNEVYFWTATNSTWVRRLKEDTYKKFNQMVCGDTNHGSKTRGTRHRRALASLTRALAGQKNFYFQALVIIFTMGKEVFQLDKSINEGFMQECKMGTRS